MTAGGGVGMAMSGNGAARDQQNATMVLDGAFVIVVTGTSQISLLPLNTLASTGTAAVAALVPKRRRDNETAGSPLLLSRTNNRATAATSGRTGEIGAHVSCPGLQGATVAGGWMRH